jgi:hypothetical protein
MGTIEPAVIVHPTNSWTVLTILLAASCLLPSTVLWAQNVAENDKNAANNDILGSTSDRIGSGFSGTPSSSKSPETSFSGHPSQPNADAEPEWIRSWLRAVDTARASQPHFTAPIVTTHVILVQQYRYDMSWQQDPSGQTVTSNYGASRGLEIIPTTRLEVGVFPPNYLVHQSNVKDGIGDLAWQIKFRAFSATEHKGDYVVGFFLGGTYPTGTQPNGIGHATLSPTFAAGKGLGPWDIQSTVGGVLPLSGTGTLSRSIVFNTAVNYRFKGMVWPMLEQNSIFWSGGTMDGKKQVFLTPGLVLGSFKLKDRLRIAVGGGLQTAVTSYHQYNHRWIFSTRFPF